MSQNLFRRALDSDEKTYGSDHPEVATTLNNLGNVLREQGQLDEAKNLFQRALRIFQEVLGDDHEKTANVRRRLASLEPDDEA